MRRYLYLGGLEGGGTRHGERGQETEPPPGLPQQEDDGGGICVTVGQLSVLSPSEGHRPHGVHDHDDGDYEEVEEEDHAGEDLHNGYEILRS